MDLLMKLQQQKQDATVKSKKLILKDIQSKPSINKFFSEKFNQQKLACFT